MTSINQRLFRITFGGMEAPWEGSFDELLEVNDELPPSVIGAIKFLDLKDPYKVHLNEGTVFTVERIQ